PLPIRYRSFGCVTILQVARRRLAAMDFALPQQLSGFPIDRVQHPAMLVLGSGLAIAAEIETLLGSFLLPAGDDGREVDSVVRDPRRRPAASGDWSLPDDVLRGAPGLRKVRAFDHPRGRSSELSPRLVGRGNGQGEGCEQDESATG